MSVLKEKTILVVERDQTQREALAHAFQFSGASVLVCNSGTTALETVKSRHIDLFFSEIELIGPNFEVLRHLRETLKSRALVFLSAMKTGYPLENLKQMGVVEVFRKPLSIDRVIQSVRDEVIKRDSQPVTNINLEKVNFLLVQEDLSQIEAMSNLLAIEYPNANIIGALNPKSGIQKLARQKFDLVVSDMNLGKYNGINFIRAVGSDPSLGSNLKFILTGEGAAPEDLEGLPGTVIYCSKPLEQRNFLESVKKLVVIQPRDGISSSVKVDVGFINPFIDSALKVFGTMVGVMPVKEQIFLKKAGQPSGDISGVMEMNSDRYYGSMSISFGQECFLKIISKMLGKEYAEITSEIQDGVAELCNQIYGNAKTLLNERGYSLIPAIPSIQVGKAHAVKHTARGACIVIQFATELGPFTIEAILEPR